MKVSAFTKAMTSLLVGFTIYIIFVTFGTEQTRAIGLLVFFLGFLSGIIFYIQDKRKSKKEEKGVNP